MAEALHVLPYSGGLFDQPAGALLRLETILVATAQVSSATSNKAEAQQRLKERTS